MARAAERARQAAASQHSATLLMDQVVSSSRAALTIQSHIRYRARCIRRGKAECHHNGDNRTITTERGSARVFVASCEAKQPSFKGRRAQRLAATQIQASGRGMVERRRYQSAVEAGEVVLQPQAAARSLLVRGSDHDRPLTIAQATTLHPRASPRIPYVAKGDCLGRKPDLIQSSRYTLPKMRPPSSLLQRQRLSTSGLQPLAIQPPLPVILVSTAAKYSNWTEPHFTDLGDIRHPAGLSDMRQSTSLHDLRLALTGQLGTSPISRLIGSPSMPQLAGAHMDVPWPFSPPTQGRKRKNSASPTLTALDGMDLKVSGHCLIQHDVALDLRPSIQRASIYHSQRKGRLLLPLTAQMSRPRAQAALDNAREAAAPAALAAFAAPTGASTPVAVAAAFPAATAAATVIKGAAFTAGGDRRSPPSGGLLLDAGAHGVGHNIGEDCGPSLHLNARSAIS